MELHYYKSYSSPRARTYYWVSQKRRMKGAGHVHDRRHEMHIRKERTIVGDILMEFLDLPYVMFTSDHQRWNPVFYAFTALFIEPTLRLAARLSLPSPWFVPGRFHVGLVVDLGCFLLKVLWFSPVSSITSLLRIYISFIYHRRYVIVTDSDVK